MSPTADQAAIVDFVEIASRVEDPINSVYPVTVTINENDLIGTGAVGAALNIIASDSDYDRIEAHTINGELGDTVVAVVDAPELVNAIYVTNDDFDPTERITRKNAPFEPGDVIPNPGTSDGNLEMIDWPTGGPLFENKSGMQIQIETQEVDEELTPIDDDSQIRSTSGQDDPRMEYHFGDDDHATVAETGEARTQHPRGQPQDDTSLRDEQGRVASDPINPEQNIPDSPGDVMGETPSLWPGADDVFRTIAPTAAQLAVNDYNAGNQPRTAAVTAANNTLDEWLGYSGDMRRQAEEALANWLIERVFDGQYDMTRFQFDPEVLPVDTEMREMALRFIENDLQGQVREDKIEDAKQLFIQRATDPDLAQAGFHVGKLLEGAFTQANVDNPGNRARRFNPDDQRAVGGAAGADSMDVVWPRGISEEEVGNVGAMMSDQGYDRELYGPLTAGQLPTDPMLLKRLAGIMEDFAETRADRGDHDGHGFYLRLAGLMYQALDQQR